MLCRLTPRQAPCARLADCIDLEATVLACIAESGGSEEARHLRSNRLDALLQAQSGELRDLVRQVRNDDVDSQTAVLDSQLRAFGWILTRTGHRDVWRAIHWAWIGKDSLAAAGDELQFLIDDNSWLLGAEQPDETGTAGR